jgi:hypothetical protein
MPGIDNSGSTVTDENVRMQAYGSTRQDPSTLELSYPDDVFEDSTRPQRKEAISALVDAGLLSSLEAEAYVRYVIEGEHNVEEQPFSRSCVESAKQKIAAARKSFSILNAYRYPKPPETCSECGSSLGDVWTTNLEETSLCLECGEASRSERDS